MKITFTNSLTKKKELFIPQKEFSVSLYVCGITPYDFSHIGHGRCYVVFDLLVRFLRLAGYNVSYVRNYTDIDDKIINRVQEKWQNNILSLCSIFTEKYIQNYKKEMLMLGCIEPTKEPKVTEHIKEIVCFIQDLIDKKSAYVLDGDVYFDISSFSEYGKLSGKKIDELEAGARVKVDERKNNPGDFVLWKGNDTNSFWRAPWGYGRPGWHIECSAMVKKYLGKMVDIHGGGMDLIFPHHENEIAQSESINNKPFARYWLHNAFVNINKEKMSKSIGNTVLLKDIFEQYDSMVLRYFFIQHHYRTPIDFSFEELESVKTAYKKLIANFTHFAEDSVLISCGDEDKDMTEPLNTVAIQLLETKGEGGTFKNFYSSHPLVKEMLDALADDLNSPKVLGLIFQNLSEIKNTISLWLSTKKIIQEVLGLSLEPLSEKKIEITSEIQKLIDERNKARNEKDWNRSDAIREELQKLGIDVHDKKTH